MDHFRGHKPTPATLFFGGFTKVTSRGDRRRRPVRGLSLQFDESAYRRFRGDVYRLAYRRLRDHSASEDIVQDSFLRLANYKSNSIANIGGMLRKIARNLIVDRTRFRARQSGEALCPEQDICADEPSAENMLLHKERMEQVSEILARMPPLRRQVFIMRRLHGMSAKEVGAALSITPAAVDTHVARAVLALHKGLSSLNADEAAG